MRFFFVSLALLLSNSVFSQNLTPSVSLNLKTNSITGTVIDAQTGKPLEYASVGIINTYFGSVTSENGEFSFEAKGLTSESKIRFSMIGYAPQVYKVDEFLSKNGQIQLVETSISIPEVIIKPSNKTKKVGVTSFDRFGEWCGWGGLQFGRGNEVGTRIDLGSKPVLLSKLHVRILRQSFDTSCYRLHIRQYKNNAIGEELLTSNIIIYLTKESGWDEVDLGKYNLIFSGEVVFTLEWLKVKGNNENRAMKINKKISKAYILFRTHKDNRGMFRWGVEANWYVNNPASPAMYLTVKE